MRDLKAMLFLGIWRLGHWTFVGEAELHHELAVGPVFFYWTTDK